MFHAQGSAAHTIMLLHFGKTLLASIVERSFALWTEIRPEWLRNRPWHILRQDGGIVASVVH